MRSSEGIVGSDLPSTSLISRWPSLLIRLAWVAQGRRAVKSSMTEQPKDQMSASARARIGETQASFSFLPELI